MLDFVINSMLVEDTNINGKRSRRRDTRDERVFEAIETLVRATRSVVTEVAENLERISSEVSGAQSLRNPRNKTDHVTFKTHQRDLQTLTAIMNLTRKLLITATESHLDYAAVQALAGWIGDELVKCTQDLPHIQASYQTLSASVAPTTGLGLHEIWGAFLSRSSAAQDSRVRELDQLSQNLTPDENAYGLSACYYRCLCLTFLSRTTPECFRCHVCYRYGNFRGR